MLFIAVLAMACQSDDSGSSSASKLKMGHQKFVPGNLDSRPCVTTYGQFSEEYNLNKREFFMMRYTENSGFDGIQLFVYFTGDDVSGTYDISPTRAHRTATVMASHQAYEGIAVEGSVVIQDLGNGKYHIEFPGQLHMQSIFGGTDSFALSGSYQGNFFETLYPNHF